MIKIGTLTCLHSNNVCARVGCLKAFQNRSDFFDGYSPDRNRIINFEYHAVPLLRYSLGLHPDFFLNT